MSLQVVSLHCPGCGSSVSTEIRLSVPIAVDQ